MKIYLLFILTFFVCGCFGNQKSNIDTTKNQPLTKQALKNLIGKANKKYGISEIEQNKDTLSIVIANRIIYYPFGRATQINELKNIDSHFKLTEERKRDKYSGDTIKLHKLAYKASYLEFFKDSESELLEMTSGDILDKEIVLPDNIHIGMSLTDFMKLYFPGDIDCNNETIKIVKLISGLTGIWEYYIFKQGELTSIHIATDYTFDKN